LYSRKKDNILSAKITSTMQQKTVFIYIVILLTTGLKTLEAQMVKDIDGNVYKTVTIGTQTWMAENLKTTKYYDGIAIPLVTDDSAWKTHDSISLIAPAYYWYNNDTSYKDSYGALYNGYTIKTGRLCPVNWHVPTDVEWSILTTYLGGEGVAGGKLKEKGFTHWKAPNTGATNETTFNALPGGSRFMDGIFKLVNESGNWWSSSDYNTERTWFRGMNNNIEFVIKGPLEKPNGVSVRCIKD
jgi:uncharacterized protein (TIGR02145 family)